MTESKLKYNIVDYSGKRFGRLLVIKCIESTPKKEGRGKWLCKCDCGKDHIVNGTAFTKNGAKSCGCLQREKASITGKAKRSPERVTYTSQYCYHKKRCRDKKCEPLPKDTWLSIVTQPCYYCGGIDKRNNVIWSSGKTISSFTDSERKEYEKEINGIDRIDSSKGYEPDNCVPCCLQCNYMKHEMSQEQFYEKIEKILSHRVYRQLDIQSFITV